MSQYPASPDSFDHPDTPRSNPLAIVGFILAFCVSPVGLIVSLIALGKRPKGFAVAGVIIGLVGTVVWGVIGAGAYAARKYGLADAFMITGDFVQFKEAAESYKKTNGAWPAETSAAGVSSDVLTDPWNRPYVYAVGADGAGWTFTSLGEDGSAGTADDIQLRDTMEPDEAGRLASETMMKTRGGSRAPAPTVPAPTQPAPSDAPATPAETPR